MIDVTIRAAVPADVDEFVRLEGQLFAEDAGVHDRFGDVTWPDRHGAVDFDELLASPTALILIATSTDAASDARTVGLLAAYSRPSSATFLPATYGVLRSMYVDGPARGRGVGSLLVDAFVDWARLQGCDELLVDHYAANTGAGRFYERHGFTPQSIQRVRPV